MVDELKAEIAKIEQEARQALANANFMAGVIHGYNEVLKKIEIKEKTDGVQ